MNNMSKKSNRKTDRGNKSLSEKSKKIDTHHNPSLVIHICDLKPKVDVDDECISKEEKKRLKGILKILSRDIWIDKTYVDFKGNRWKDAFITEDGWYEFCNMIIETDFGKKCSKKKNEEIVNYLMVITMIYLYTVIEKYDFDIENIIISFKKNSKFRAEYNLDTRTSWRF